MKQVQMETEMKVRARYTYNNILETCAAFCSLWEDNSDSQSPAPGHNALHALYSSPKAFGASTSTPASDNRLLVEMTPRATDGHFWVFDLENELDPAEAPSYEHSHHRATSLIIAYIEDLGFVCHIAS